LQRDAGNHKSFGLFSSEKKKSLLFLKKKKQKDFYFLLDDARKSGTWPESHVAIQSRSKLSLGCFFSRFNRHAGPEQGFAGAFSERVLTSVGAALASSEL
jgi:hypothetical protein